VDLNRWINAEYGRLGERFQAIIDTSFSSVFTWPQPSTQLPASLGTVGQIVTSWN